MVKVSIDGVKLAWVDNGQKMWDIMWTRLDDGTQWTMRHWARDELDAYKIAIRKLKGASK